MELEAHWNNRYESNPDEGLSWTEADPSISYDWITQSSSPDDLVADIGAGRSKLLSKLLQAGYSRLAHVELSQSASDETRARLGKEAEGKVEWYVGDARQWRSAEPVSLWHDRAVFHFLVSEDEQRPYIEALDANLKSGGTLIIATFHTDGPEKCSGLPVQRYDAAGLSEILNRMSVNDWILEDELIHEHQTPGGNNQLFQYAKFRVQN